MEILHLKADITVFGVRVKNFPAGIGDAFDALVKMIPGGFNRSYYGISQMKNNECLYYATAIETFPGEAGKYACEKLIIEKGTYLAVTVHDWRKQTDCIKDVFQEIMQDRRVDHTKPCVEWYKDDTEMLCMLKINQTEI